MKRLIRKLKATSYYDKYGFIPLWVLKKEIQLMKAILAEIKKQQK